MVSRNTQATAIAAILAAGGCGGQNEAAKLPEKSPQAITQKDLDQVIHMATEVARFRVVHETCNNILFNDERKAVYEDITRSTQAGYDVSKLFEEVREVYSALSPQDRVKVDNGIAAKHEEWKETPSLTESLRFVQAELAEVKKRAESSKSR